MPRRHASQIRFRGTPKGEIRALVSEALARMVQDLTNLEKKGYGEDVCDIVKNALIAIRIASVDRSGSNWVAGIASHAGDFCTTYVRWNGQGKRTTRDAILRRRSEIKDLQEYTSHMSSSFKKNHWGMTAISRTEAEFCDIAFGQLDGLAQRWPEYFKSLRSALRNRKRRTKRAK